MITPYIIQMIHCGEVHWTRLYICQQCAGVKFSPLSVLVGDCLTLSENTPLVLSSHMSPLQFASPCFSHHLHFLLTQVTF